MPLRAGAASCARRRWWRSGCTADLWMVSHRQGVTGWRWRHLPVCTQHAGTRERTAIEAAAAEREMPSPYAVTELVQRRARQVRPEVAR